jgi:acetyl esterase/lipase
MPEFVFKPFEKPAQPGEIVLPSVPASTPDREQWMLQGELVNVRNVTRPTLVPVLPAGKSTGAAMIVAPGGGFLGLAIDHEGWQIARWLANHGIAAFVLKYRVLPTPRDNDEFMRALHGAMQGKPTGVAPPADTPPEALADGLAAIRHVREHAKEFGVDPHRVGFMGFSAGGFLSRSVVSKGGKDAPDFVAPIYPNMASLDVPANAPPMFVAIAADDFLLAREKGLPLVDSYRAAGAPIEFHLLANGGHGFGLEHGTKGKASEDWIELLHRWMGAIGVLDAKSE